MLIKNVYPNKKKNVEIVKVDTEYRNYICFAVLSLIALHKYIYLLSYLSLRLYIPSRYLYMDKHRRKDIYFRFKARTIYNLIYILSVAAN